MNTLTCKYHSDREASAKCERCGAMVCLECKNVLRQTHHSSSTDSSFSSSYSTRHDLCPECYAQKINQRYNPVCCILPLCCIIGFMGVGFGMVSLFTSFSENLFDNDLVGDNPLGGLFSDGFSIALAFMIGVPILMIFCLGYNFFITGPKAKAEANRRRDVALSAMHGSGSFSSESTYSTDYTPPSTTYTPSSATYTHRSKQDICQNCGQKLDPGSSFCSGCGSFTHD